jgi:hypothetical protein
MVAKINQINQEITKNPLFEQLGIRSNAAIEENKKAVMRSYDTLAIAAKGNHTELVRLEAAKNEQLKRLNDEMVGTHNMSMAAMTRAVLRFYAAYYVISSGLRGTFDFIMSGVKSIDSMKISVASVAAQITTMQGDTGNVTENYRKNVEYAKALIPALMQVDASSLANYEQIQKMNMAMTNQGVILDANNAKQIDAFTALTNAVALYTQGQDKERQASQEIRALMSGQVRAGNMLALQMDAAIKQQGIYKGGLKELVAEGRKHNDTLERMKPYLAGIVAAAGDLGTTWEAVSTSAETAWGVVQRALFKDFYKDLTSKGKDFTQWMKSNADDIAEYIKNKYEEVKFAIELVVASLLIFETVSIASAVKAGSVISWLTKLWSFYGQTVNLAISRMALSWGVFIGAIAGWSIGKYLSDEFEWARFAGVSMVYGVMNAWAWFTEKLEIGWEAMKMIAKHSQATSAEEIESITAATQARIAEIKRGYQQEKDLRDKFRDEQFKAESDAGRAAAKAAADAAKNIKTEVPKIPGTPDFEKDSVRDQQEIIQKKIQADKAYYEEQVKTAEQAAKLSQRAGQDEYKTINDLYNAKATLLNNYLEIEYQNAEKETQIESAAAKISKDGIAKKFDYTSVLQAKYDKIFADYNKTWAKNEGERAIANEDAAKKTIETMAGLYGTINQYSDEYINSQIKKLEEEYTQKGRYVKGSLALEVALEIERKKLLQNRNKGLADFYSNLSGMEKEYRENQFAWIDKEYEQNKKLYGEKAALLWKQQELWKAMSVGSEDGNSNEGFKYGLYNFSKNIGNEFTRAQKMADSVATNMSSSFSNIFFDGVKGELKSFSDYWQSFNDALLRTVTDMISQMVVKWMLGINEMNQVSSSSGLFGLVTSVIGAIAGGVSSDVAASRTDTYLLSAKGNAFMNGSVIEAFARGGIVNTPTIFPMANGMGLMGESGAEAVVPLARTSTGDLGVKTTGGKQSTQSAGVTNVNIMALDSQSFEEFAKRNKGIFQGIVTQGLRDHKLQGEWKPLLN